MRKILFVLSTQLFWYGFCSIVAWDIRFFPDIDSFARFCYMIIATVVLAFSIAYCSSYGEGTPKWLQTPTHEEKKTGIKKYIGELHEELALYAAAMELQKKIREFKSKQ